MASHEPFPIAEFTAGQFSGREPWLSPRNAFQTLTDGRIHRGRLEKRRGYSRLSELGAEASPISGTGIGPNSNGTYSIVLGIAANGYYANLIPETVVFEWEDADTSILTAKLDLSQYPDNPLDPTIDVVDAATGATFLGSYSTLITGFFINWTLHPDYTGAGPNRGEMTYYAPVGNPVTGLSSFKASTGAESVLGFDENAIYVLDGTTGIFLEDATGVTLTGTAEDYVWTWPFDSYLMFTNNVDPVYKFTPGGSPTIEEIDTEFDSGSGGNDLDTCLIVVRFKGRAVFLNTRENATRYPRRARWSIAGNFEVHDTNGLSFADAPSHLGSIVTCQFIADRLFVGFELGWMELVDTGDSVSPLRWEVTTARHGAVAKMATVQDSYRLLHRTEFAMEAIDPNGQYHIDQAIPDYVLNLDASKRGLCAGARNDPYRSMWWTYARNSDTTPQRILAAQYDEKDELSWSVFRMAFNCFGYYSNVAPTTWDSYSPRTWDELTFPWDSAKGTSGFRSLIGGADDGTVYLFDDSDNDNGTAIALEAVSQGLTPYPGRSAHMGWVDIYATATANATLTIGWSKEDRASVLISRTVDLTPNVVTNKVYRRVLINKAAIFHRLTFTLESDSFAAIDAVVPWFKPAGQVREFA